MTHTILLDIKCQMHFNLLCLSTLIGASLTRFVSIQISRLSLHADQLNTAKQTAKGPKDSSQPPTTSRIFQILQYEEDNGFINSRGQSGSFNVVVVSFKPFRLGVSGVKATCLPQGNNLVHYLHSLFLLIKVLMVVRISLSFMEILRLFRQPVDQASLCMSAVQGATTTQGALPMEFAAGAGCHQYKIQGLSRVGPRQEKGTCGSHKVCHVPNQLASSPPSMSSIRLWLHSHRPASISI